MLHGQQVDRGNLGLIREGLDAELRQKLTDAFLTMSAKNIQQYRSQGIG